MRKQNLPTDEDFVSKSQRRREALETRSLASRLIGMSQARLAELPLEKDLLDAIAHARAIRSNVARKREMQYVAKLLRRIDEEPVLAALDAMDNAARELTARQHRTEAWRDHLLEKGDQALGELLQSRHDADVQALRTLCRNAQREARAGKPPASARSLFRSLRELDERQPLPPIGV